MDIPNQNARIRELNDAFRQSFVGGVIVITPALEELSSKVRERVLERVRTFDEWNDKDEPFGEHDFGAFKIDGVDFFWSIECYDRSMQRGTDDPTDPEKTTRVLTVMTGEDL